MIAPLLTVRRASFAAVLLLSSSLTVVSTTAAQADGWSAWASSKYTYCDAKLVAAMWNMSIDKAKVQIGLKLQNGGRKNVNAILVSSRQAGNTCTWEDTGYSYEDAEELAQIWGLKEPYQAKLKVAKYFTKGKSAIVRGVLGH